MATVKFSALANPTVIVTAIVYGFLLHLASAAGLLGILLQILITLSLWRYGYTVLRNIANGWNHFPPPDVDSTNPFGEFTVVVHTVLFVLLFFLLATTPFVPLGVRVPLFIIVFAVFPASAAIMAMTRNPGAALNPFGIASLVKDLGGDYVKLLLVSVLLGGLMAMTEWAIRSWWLGVVVDMVSSWIWLALFLATGATLRAHRTELDLMEGVDDAELREERDRHGEWQKALDRAYASVRSGLTAQAYRTVKELVASDGDSLAVYQWTFNGMLAWDEPHHAVIFGERFARRLWDEGRKVEALELAERCRKLSPQFAPPAAFTAELAAYARSLGRHRSADELTALAAARATQPDVSPRAPGP